jgi:hypothetical protein
MKIIQTSFDTCEISASHSVCFSTEKKTRYPLNRGLSGPQILSGIDGEEKENVPLTGIKHQSPSLQSL